MAAFGAARADSAGAFQYAMMPKAPGGWKTGNLLQLSFH
jgi:hypothetical protein